MFDAALTELHFPRPLNSEDVNNQPGVLFQHHVEIKCAWVSSIGVNVIKKRDITTGERVPLLNPEIEYHD